MSKLLEPDIRSEHEFILKAPVGSRVWILQSWHEKPMPPEETVIRKYAIYDGCETLNGSLLYYVEGDEHASFAGDAMNKWHGVFLSREKAELVYQFRLAKFNLLVASGALDSEGRTVLGKFLDEF